MAIAKAERLMNLALCLLGTRRPLSKRELRGSIEAYMEAGNDEAFDRMFERDKDDLRELGLVIETVENLDGEPAISPAATATGCRRSRSTPRRPRRWAWPRRSGSRPGSPEPPAAPCRSCARAGCPTPGTQGQHSASSRGSPPTRRPSNR